MHQHLRIGDGDVDWDAFFGALRGTGFVEREDALIVSNVFAEDENWEEVSTYQLQAIRRRLGDADV